MATFRVKIQREISETMTAEVEVEAATKAEAEVNALTMAAVGQVEEGEWHSESSETVSLETTDVECIDNTDEGED